jgi:CheY-like chemotaxis protein
VQKAGTTAAGAEKTMTNILVIDDDPEITTMIEMALTSAAHQVHTAPSGSVGLKLLRKHAFDFVITDILMPETDGFEVIMEINQMQVRPRIIAMTGGSQRLSQEYLSKVAYGLKVQQVLRKPFSLSELLKSVTLDDGTVEASE